MRNFLRLRQVVRPALGTGVILLIPLVMTLLDRGKADGDGWHWEAGSFIVMGALLFGAGLTYEALASIIDRWAHRAAVAVTITLIVIAVWIELAVDGISKIIGFVAA